MKLINRTHLDLALANARGMARRKLLGGAEEYFALLGAIVRQGLTVPASERAFAAQCLDRAARSPEAARKLVGARGRHHTKRQHERDGKIAKFMYERRGTAPWKASGRSAKKSVYDLTRREFHVSDSTLDRVWREYGRWMPAASQKRPK